MCFLAPLALAAIGVTVACTTNFMFTLPGWNADASFPLLNGSRVFLLKDQCLFAAAFLAGARSLVAAEPETVAWFDVRFDRDTFATFDAFDGEAGREAILADRLLPH